VRGFVAALVLLSAQPAHACHRFQRWAYPYPQRCGLKPAPSRPGDERVTVEITVTPALLETWARQDAIVQLKGQLK
jgi:hypothetical protein